MRPARIERAFGEEGYSVLHVRGRAVPTWAGAHGRSGKVHSMAKLSVADARLVAREYRKLLQGEPKAKASKASKQAKVSKAKANFAKLISRPVASCGVKGCKRQDKPFRSAENRAFHMGWAHKS